MMKQEREPTGKAWTPASTIEHMFTSVGPSGSDPPEPIAWAVLEHGTVFYSQPSASLPVDATLDAIERAARVALSELGPVVPATPGGDFQVSRLDGWFPDDPVFFVTFEHPAIATVIIESVPGDVGAGLLGRVARQRDHDEPRFVMVRNFRGARWIAE